MTQTLRFLPPMALSSRPNRNRAHLYLLVLGVLSCQKAFVAPPPTPPPRSVASAHSTHPVTSPCPVQTAQDDVFVAGLRGIVDKILIEGPYLYALSTGSHPYHRAEAGEIVRIDRETRQRQSLTGRRGRFSFVSGVPPYFYWAENADDGSGSVFRVKRPEGPVEAVVGDASCFVVDHDVYYTFLDTNLAGREFRGIHRVDHVTQNAVPLFACDAPSRCRWSAPGAMAVFGPSGCTTLHFDGRVERPCPAAESTAVSQERRGDSWVLTVPSEKGRRQGFLPFSGNVTALLVEGNVAYVALSYRRGLGGGELLPSETALFRIVLDGKTPAAQMGLLHGYEGGLAADACFFYYSSSQPSDSIRRMQRPRSVR